MPDMSMCSASQPWLLAMALPSLRARHFLPSRELPPYPDPKLKISSVLGLWAMISLSGLQGHLTYERWLIWVMLWVWGIFTNLCNTRMKGITNAVKTLK